MKAVIPLIVLGVFGLAAFSVAQDTETAGLITSLCTSAVAQDAQTKQALKIEVGSATRDDVTRSDDDVEVLPQSKHVEQRPEHGSPRFVMRRATYAPARPRRRL